jgi:hypothetical protein
VRLEAELVRDVALGASGLLVPKVGGPSVFPPQPSGVYAFTQIPREWHASNGADRYRRGMYTYFWRSAPHPGLVVFDAPDATAACTRRNRSNTPLQALTLLNDEAYTEFAEALARRVLREASPAEAPRIEHAFRLCLARSPRPQEVATLQRLLTANRTTNGAQESSNLAEWTAVARALMNLDEFITRE